MAKIFWRATVIVHRYLGVAVGLLMLMWFASGMVMMYVPYPNLSASQRVQAAATIPWASCCAFDALGFGDDLGVRAAELTGIDGEPALKLRAEGQRPSISSLAPNGPMLNIDDAKARTIALEAAPRIVSGPANIVGAETIARDQWTIETGGQPLHRFIFDDPARTRLYVSGATGDIMLWTTATQRFWNWLGAIPHWLYFTELRLNGPLWSQVVIWTSLVGGFLTMLGLFLGITQFKRGRSGRLSPYRGWFYWHHIVGLVFGVFTLTWVISGTLSMNPWGLLESEGGGGEGARLFGAAIPWHEVRDSLARIAANPPRGETVRLASSTLEGRLFWLVTARDGTKQRLDAQGVAAPITPADLERVGHLLAGKRPIASAGLMTGEDAYYFNFQASAEPQDVLPLPVYRVILNDAEQTRYYVDPATAAPLNRIDANGRANRWLFNGLHRFDFAWLRARPLWDIVVLFLMLGGLAGTATGVYLAVTRIKRDLTFRRPKKA